jgi:hypothetical protein
MALNPSIKYGHLQVEFGGEVQFNGDSSPFDYIEHTGIGNIWRFDFR